MILLAPNLAPKHHLLTPSDPRNKGSDFVPTSRPQLARVRLSLFRLPYNSLVVVSSIVRWCVRCPAATSWLTRARQ